jgi:hypothetical protein
MNRQSKALTYVVRASWQVLFAFVAAFLFFSQTAVGQTTSTNVTFTMASPNMPGTVSYTKTVSTTHSPYSYGQGNSGTKYTTTTTYSGYVFTDEEGTAHSYTAAPTGTTSWYDSPCPTGHEGAIPCSGSGFSANVSAWSNDGEFYLQVSHNGSVSVPFAGEDFHPKYTILSIDYAPPGASSYVQYSNSTTLGKSTTVSYTDSNSQKHQITVGVEAGLTGLTVSGSVTTSSEFTQEQDSSNSISLTSASQWTETVPGPQNSFVGLDHRYDVIWLWLNPSIGLQYEASNGAVIWTGYSIDANFGDEMDVYPVYLGWLQGTLSTPGPGSNDLTPLQRTWAAGEGWTAGDSAALNATDYAQIAAADPFSNANYALTFPVGSSTSSDGRFTLTGNQNISYPQAPPGGQPITMQYNLTTTEAQTTGQGTTDTQIEAWSYDIKYTSGEILKLTTDITSSGSITLTDKWSSTNSTTRQQSATAHIVGPTCTGTASCSPVYTGPTEYGVVQDNIYNTFAFNPMD